jgi:hypothetical protein
MFVHPNKISSSYTITVCELFSFSKVTLCDHFVSRVVEIVPFYPPFSYNYLCSSVSAQPVCWEVSSPTHCASPPVLRAL